MEQNEITMAYRTLCELQHKLAVPKIHRNDHGRFMYRSREDILAAMKDLLPDGALILIQDDMVNIGDRYYVKSTAKLIAGDGSSVSATAYAREPDQQTGMGAGQLSGATSSYASKYALCNLGAIDQGDDLDQRPPEGGKQGATRPSLQATEKKEVYIQVIRGMKDYQQAVAYVGKIIHDADARGFGDELRTEVKALRDRLKGGATGAPHDGRGE
jgi:hypothetical protein